MLNKPIRSTIIVTIQCIVPAMLLFIIAPQLLNHTHRLNQAQAFFTTHQLQFRLAHAAFYLTLFWIWPLLIRLIISNLKRTPDALQIKIALSARWYLITVMAFFEILSLWTSS